MLGIRIAALRRQAGLTQRQLASLLSISPSAVGMYEQGRREPSADQIVAMAELFGVSTDFLLTGTPSPADTSAWAEFFEQAAGQIKDYTIRRPDGAEIPMNRETLAVLFAALFHEP